jgi:DNA polymerase-3 subunit gamma/tau
MSYLVLARKWRPRSFRELVGQEHVVRALSNALDHQRLHHAYLFTGTRGVGKTTIARILAKSLNCEQGVTSQPCGVCSACTEIDAGRFVDLLEVDAASRTKVDQTRELLENVPYAPVRGRYKVYLIDEVHMFSESSFNALLKTLEEPPPHVKFLLATTDPQKVPVTVLSRCLQFNLKRLSPELIQGQLAKILGEEGIRFEEGAIALIARAADGSVRDGLSLLDQAIAFGGGQVLDADVRSMLGTVAREWVHELLEALADGNGRDLLAVVARLAEQAPDFAAVLAELLEALHAIAVLQLVPEARGESTDDRLVALAARLAPEDAQLFYQIGLMGQRDLPFAPDPRGGLEMVLLRMLAFRPEEGPVRPADRDRPRSRATPSAAPEPAASGPEGDATRRSRRLPDSATDEVARQATTVGPAAPAAASDPVPDFADWHGTVGRLGLGGMALQLARNCVVESWDGSRLKLALDPSHGHLLGSRAEDRLTDAIGRLAGRPITMTIATAPVAAETPARRAERADVERREAALAAMRSDEVVQALAQQFDARLLEDSVVPRDGEPAGRD